MMTKERWRFCIAQAEQANAIAEAMNLMVDEICFLREMQESADRFREMVFKGQREAEEQSHQTMMEVLEMAISGKIGKREAEHAD